MLTIFSLIVLLFSVMIHEIAHGSIANFLGDPTAKNAGRLTLNPIRHLDIFGSILLPLMLVIIKSPFIVGWAKPVPVNPYNFRDQKSGIVKVAIAGPAANFLVAIIFGILIRFSFLSAQFLFLFSVIAFINLLLGFFNLLPISPLDGFNFFFNLLPDSLWKIKAILQQYGMFILVLFIIFGFGFLIIPVRFFYYLITGMSSPW